MCTDKNLLLLSGLELMSESRVKRLINMQSYAGY